jgi:endonuclease YncB( thermonuclease family)
MFLSLKPLSRPDAGGSALMLAAAFAAGLGIGTSFAPVFAARDPSPAPLPPAAAPSTLRAGHPAEVLRVLDGDTFEARVRIWPGTDITTKIRLRGIDAPELKAQCAGEQQRAQESRQRLATILAQGDVGVSNVTIDKYGGRVIADASTRATADIASALLDAGMARRYAGGKRESWCR